MERTFTKTKYTKFRKTYLYKGSEDSNEKGKRNERRALEIMEAMAIDGSIKKARKASGKQNREGVDIWVTLADFEGTRIPFQVKSSAQAAKDYRERRVYDSIIVILVVNEFKNDIEIRGDIKGKIRKWCAFNLDGTTTAS